jgi:hypothetical protein
MRARRAYAIPLALVLITCWGCATSITQKKPTVKAPGIIEEDVTGSRSVAPSEQPGPAGGEVGPVPPGVDAGAPGPPNSENSVSGRADPAKRPKARIKWQDKGPQKGWERMPERIEGQ